jgi:hypothetical protein
MSYSQCERYQLDRLHLDSSFLNRYRVFGTFAFAQNTTHRTSKSKRFYIKMKDFCYFCYYNFKEQL